MRDVTSTPTATVAAQPRWYSESWASALTATVVAAVGSLLLGGLTSFGQAYLPAPLRSFANSSGGWTMLAFLLVWAGRARPLLGAALGVVAFEGLVEGYGVVSSWRGFFYADPFSGIFSLIGFAAGPVLGVAASLTRWGRPRWQVLGVTPLVAVLVGEGVWGLRYVAETTGPVYWILQLVLGPVFLVVAIRRFRPHRAEAVLAVATAAVGAAAFLGLYDTLFS